MSDRNGEIIELLGELVELTILDEGSSQSFRVRAYENAMHELELVRDDIAAMSVKELCKIEGVGKSTAQKIREYFDTGKMSKVEKLREKYPPAYRELAKIPGVGPKSMQKLRSELGIEDLDGLRAAVAQHKIRELAGFGEKSEEKIGRAIARLGLSGKHHRTPIADALPLAEALVAELEAMPEIERATFCGSLRRFRETVADVDIVAVSTDPAPVMQRFVERPGIKEVLGHGDTKSSIVTASGLQVDLRVVEPAQYGAAILYFTGSKAHNIALRQRAIDRGWTLNEYGLTHAETGDVVAQETEEAIYDALEMVWVPPPMREDTGEVALAAGDELPAVLTVVGIGGDLHGQTTGTDGNLDLPELVAAAAAAGHRFIAIADRGGDLLAQADAITELRERHSSLRIFHGCELAIAADGSLVIDDRVRERIDFAIAGIHDDFELDADAQTDRLIAAMADPLVRILAHPTCRRIGNRDPIALDADRLLRAAVDADTAIEINANLERLDAPAELLRRAGELGATFAVGAEGHLDRLRHGACLAQRGWVLGERVVNSWSADRIADWLASR